MPTGKQLGVIKHTQLKGESRPFYEASGPSKRLKADRNPESKLEAQV